MAVLLLLVVAGCTPEAAPPGAVRLTPQWVAADGFRWPESVVHDAQRGVLYVSNVNGYAKNGLGFLSRVGLDGQVLDQPWIDGLNGPTGMALRNDTLFVADLDALVAIDPATGRVVARYPAPDAQPGLNDVAVDPRGRLFVSGSFTRAIYTLTGAGLRQWVQSDRLRDANGLHAESGRLLIAGYHLLQVAYADRAITPLLADTLPADSLLVDLESIVADGRGGYFVTAVGPLPIWHVRATGAAAAVLERDTYSADVAFLATEQLLVVPSGGDRLFAFRVAFER